MSEGHSTPFDCPSPTCDEAFRSEAAIYRHLAADHEKDAPAGHALRQSGAAAPPIDAAPARRDIYVVRHATYGERRGIEYVTFTEDDAVERARELADGARYELTPNEHYDCEGYAQAGNDIYQVLRFTVEDPALVPEHV